MQDLPIFSVPQGTHPDNLDLIVAWRRSTVRLLIGFYSAGQDVMSSTLVYIVYPVASFVVFLFGVIALIIGTFYLRKNGPDTQEFFLTARNSANVFRIAFSYFAGVLGSWSLFGLPSFAYTAGNSASIRQAFGIVLDMLS